MIFHEIWEADMTSNGVLPLIKGVSEDPKKTDTGYVIVDMNPMPEPDSSANASEHNKISVFKEVVIPAGKQRSYDLFMKLHDKTTSTGAAEINEFLGFAANTPPMRLARKYAEDNHQLKAGCSMEEWIQFLKAIWFEPFKGSNTCYFEQVFLGGQGGKRHKLGGQLFWYHYYVNDGPYEALKKADSIVFIKHVEVTRTEESKLAEVISIKYTLEEQENGGQSQISIKDAGGFFVGTSAEGLMAMGTVASLDGREHIPVELNGESFDLTVVHMKENGKDLARTFYPVIKEAVPV
ncbi:hypothetical protein [Paenibacillus sp. HW567]|uniref:hypothetical protein n=1 Tax=Paenibacillus sp. HW567 TaxID=1034769 RepID=UPI0003653951|nr:hypothetical protein [Paenibacillus sp. HW567]